MQNYVSGWLLITILPAFNLFVVTKFEPGDQLVLPDDLWIDAGFTVVSLFGFFYCLRPTVCVEGEALVVTNPVFRTRVGLGRVVTVRDAFWFPRLVLDDGREIVLWALEETNSDHLRGLDRGGVLGDLIDGQDKRSDTTFTRENILLRGPLVWFTLAINASYWILGIIQTLNQ
jgi:hypothetical protein